MFFPLVPKLIGPPPHPVLSFFKPSWARATAFGMTRNLDSSLRCRIWRRITTRSKTRVIRIGIAQEQLRVADSPSPCRTSKSIQFLKDLLLWAIARFGLEQWSQNFRFVNQHWFHIDLITSNYNIETMSTKHKVVKCVVRLFLYFIDASPTLKGWIIS